VRRDPCVDRFLAKQSAIFRADCIARLLGDDDGGEALQVERREPRISGEVFSTSP
jgi:hypothetical protein